MIRGLVCYSLVSKFQDDGCAMSPLYKERVLFFNKEDDTSTPMYPPVRPELAQHPHLLSLALSHTYTLYTRCCSELARLAQCHLHNK